MNKLIKILVIMLGSTSIGSALAATLNDIEFSSLSGDRTEIVLKFDSAVSEPSSYAIERPARISVDLPGAISDVAKYHQIGNGNTRSATILTAGDKTRVILNLTRLVPYSVKRTGNSLSILVGESAEEEVQFAEEAGTEVTFSNEVPEDVITLVDGDPIITDSEEPAFSPKETNVPTTISARVDEVSDIDFRRNEKGDGQVVFTFTNASADAEISDEGGKIRIQVPGFEVPENLRRRLDVIDFATTVKFVDSFQEGDTANFVIENNGFYDYLAYQADRSLTIDVKEITEEEREELLKEKFPYNGEKLSLNFQDIPVRSVLQLIADFTGLNLVASDSINGSITLRLKNVPWDQALDLVLKTKGLDKRQSGNVLLVAPAEEIAAREKLELEANTQLERLAPLVTEFIQINYAQAADVMTLLQSQQTSEEDEEVNSFAGAGAGGLLSSRGTISVDGRTNTLMIRDTAAHLERIRRAVTVFDVPVKQVLIEARIVRASSTAARELGVNWSSSYTAPTTIADEGYTATVGPAIANLGVAAPSSTLAVGYTTADYALSLQLSALESNGNAEIVSQPKILTADGQTATIRSGTQIPYLSGDTITFRDAFLELEVLPQITPDNRFVLDLDISQDSPGAQLGGFVDPATGESSGGVTPIDTNQLTTQVLVNNGETIVLGGVYQSTQERSVSKTPFLGDIPVVGALFRRTTTSNVKSELLIFITPKLVEDGLAGR